MMALLSGVARNEIEEVTDRSTRWRPPWSPDSRSISWLLGHSPHD